MHFIPYKNIAKDEIANYCFINENTKLKLKEGVHLIIVSLKIKVEKIFWII